jgi:hypothetical protein
MPAGATYEPLATTTLGSSQADITFSSISSSYTDLKIVAQLRSDRASTFDSLYTRFNSDTGTTYSETFIYGDGSSALSSRESNVNQILSSQVPAASIASNIYSLSILDIFSYAGSTNKTVLITNSSDTSGNGRVSRYVGLWRSTSAINAIRLFPAFGTNWVAGSTATLYGIKAA